MSYAIDRTERVTVPVRRQEGVLGGKVIIAGTRVPVYMVEKVYRERGLDAVREGYPQLTEAEILGALFFASAYPEEIERDWRAVNETFKGTPLAE